MQQDIFICPNCGRETEFPIVHNVNVTMEPRFKDEILSRRLFHFGCSCDFEMEVTYPMLYHDMEKKMMLFFLPNEEDRVPEGVEAALAPLAEEGYIFRIVRSTDALCEKIRLRDAGLDDRVMELLKFVNQAPFKEVHQEKVLYRVTYELDEEEKPHLVFHCEKDDLAVPFEKEQYDIVKKEWENMPEEDGFFKEIDEIWARKVLAQ